jgi:DNA-binding transcriptional regulator YiaG
MGQGQSKRDLVDVKGKRLVSLFREFRQKRGLSRKQASNVLGINWRTIESWEQGRYLPTGLYRERLEQMLKSHPLKS